MKKASLYGRTQLMADISSHLVAADFMLAEHSLYISPSRGIIVKVTPAGDGNDSYWHGLLFEVFGRTGKIDSTMVHFDRLLTRAPDSRPDYREGLYIWRNDPGINGTEDWYIARPKTLEPLYMLVNRFVEFWGDRLTK